MRHTVAVSRVQPGERKGSPVRRYESLAHFYRADERRLHSRELDVGLWWRERPDGLLHRAAWISDTGELYLVRLGAPAEGGGEVELLAHVPTRERLEAVLHGWREQCGGPRSLAWLRERSRQAVRERGKRSRPSWGIGSQLTAESTNCR
jgi:hypothetical protein